MLRFVRSWLPESGIVLLFLFFALRELSSFPAAWADDSLYMIIAKRMAAGQGFGISVWGQHWMHPIFPVGPTLFIPIALAINFVGFSVAAARIPMVGFLMLTTIAFYILNSNIAGKTVARWSTLLLVTLSAFINTGKPVLAEVPSFFFLLSGLLCLERSLCSSDDARSARYVLATASGIFLGLAAVTKLPSIVALGALPAAILWTLFTRRFADACILGTVLLSSITILFMWFLYQYSVNPHEFLMVYGQYLHGEALHLTDQHVTPTLLLRIPYLAFFATLVVGAVGMWEARRATSRSLLVVIAGMTFCFVLYFFLREGWYRHVLAAHLLILPFVPIGMQKLFTTRFAATALTVLIAAQGWWQLSYRGSTRGEPGAHAAQLIAENYQDRDLLIEDATVFVRLPENVHWRLGLSSYPLLEQQAKRSLGLNMSEGRCLPVVRRMTEEDAKVSGQTKRELEGSIMLFAPPSDC